MHTHFEAFLYLIHALHVVWFSRQQKGSVRIFNSWGFSVRSQHRTSSTDHTGKSKVFLQLKITMKVISVSIHYVMGVSISLYYSSQITVTVYKSLSTVSQASSLLGGRKKKKPHTQQQTQKTTITQLGFVKEINLSWLLVASFNTRISCVTWMVTQMQKIAFVHVSGIFAYFCSFKDTWTTYNHCKTNYIK